MILSALKKVADITLTPVCWVGELIVKTLIILFVRAMWREYKNHPLKESHHDSVIC